MLKSYLRISIWSEILVKRAGFLGGLLIMCLMLNLALLLLPIELGNNIVLADDALADSPWPMFNHDLQHTGRSPYTGPETPYLAWSHDSPGRNSSPAIGTDGTIYVGSDHAKFYALNPDGSLKWSYTTGSVKSSPAVGADGTIYISSDDNKLYAINPDGSLKWSYTTGSDVYWYIHSSPAIGTDGTIYVGSRDGKLYALNLDGSLKWNYTTGAEIYSSPAIGTDGTIYIGSLDHKLYAINPDGSLKWNYTTGHEIFPSPAIGTDGTIYVGSDDEKLYAINPDGSLKWNYTTGHEIKSSPAIGNDGSIYVGSRDGKLYAINPDGSLKWNYTTGGEVYSSPAIGADGTIYIGSRDGKLYAINPDGSLKWSYTTGAEIYSSPAIGADGIIYFKDRDGFYAIGGNQPPIRPSNTSPSDGAASFSLTPTLTSSAFSDPSDGATHAASQWQIESLYYTSPGSVDVTEIYDSGTDTSNLTQLAIPSGTLNYDIIYRWRVRHMDNHNAWSEWSVETSFTTVDRPPNQPANVSPVDGTSNVSLTPTLQSSTFADADTSDAHGASQWQLTATSGQYSSPVFDSGNDATNLTSIIIPPGNLTYSTVYYWRVRYQDILHSAWSDWSPETSFSTIAEKKDGGLFDCLDCDSKEARTSVSELLIGWGIVGLCWGGGSYMVKRIGRSNKR